MPYYSVIIPTYNRARLLEACLSSVLQQTFSDYEVIVVDNGSSDDTQAAVEKFDDRRVRYLWQEGTGSPAGPRNRGIDLARGRWLAFLDSDDLWFPDKLLKVSELSASGRYDLVSHWQCETDMSGAPRGILRSDPSPDASYRNLLLTENTLVTSGVTVDKMFLAEHGLRFSEKPEHIAVEDQDLWLRVAAHGGRFGFVKQPLGVSRAHEDHTGNTALFLRNQGHLLHEHVWTVQRFTGDKTRLQRRITTALAMRKTMTALRSFSFSEVITGAGEALKNDPIEIFRYVAYRLRRRMDALRDRGSRKEMLAQTPLLVRRILARSPRGN